MDWFTKESAAELVQRLAQIGCIGPNIMLIPPVSD